MKTGITGHQDLGDSGTASWVEDALNHAISKNQVTEGFTSLATGADQLFAKTLREKEIPYTVIVPCQQYEATFITAESRSQYAELLASARLAITLSDNEEPTEYAFLQAGRLVADMADLLIAVWNGEAARGLGGTGDIVQYARAKGKNIVHINPVTRVISVLRQEG